ncbi:MAG: glycerophosphodiester phosphodiesterase family protein [Alphaproteobacteria bacterium]
MSTHSLDFIPPVLGHRGSRMHAPENTLAGIRSAHEQGCRGVELDVKITRDGVPVLLHDDSVDRTTTGTGNAYAIDARDMVALDAGTPFSPDFAGEPVPYLRDAIALVLDLGLVLNLEIKPDAGKAVETTQAALDVLGKMWPDDRPPPLISSFHAWSVGESMRLRPDWPRGLIMDERAPDWQKLVGELQLSSLHPAHAREDDAGFAEMMATGCKILTYTCNEADRAQHLLSLGVTSVITDTPKTLFDAGIPS